MDLADRFRALVAEHTPNGVFPPGWSRVLAE